MAYDQAILIIMAVVSVAAGASWLGGRLVPIDLRRSHHEVGGPVFAQIGMMISVLLAFVFSEVWSEYRTAAQAINGECGALHGAAMLANALPGGEGAPVSRAIRTYLASVTTTEWRSMAHRDRSPLAASEIEAALDQAAKLNVGGADTTTKGQILSLLAEAHSNRETRLFQLTLSAPAVMWFMLIAISIILVLFVVFAGLEDPGRTLFVVVFSGSITLVLVLVRLLDFPFEGALALPNTDFVKLLSEIPPLANGRV